MIRLPITEYIEYLLEAGEYERCSVYLKMLDKGELSDSLLVGIVELTHGHMVHLSNWEGVYNQVHDELDRRSLDPQQLLPWMARVV